MLIVCRDVCIELGITSLSNGIDCCTEIHWLDTDFLVFLSSGNRNLCIAWLSYCGVFLCVYLRFHESDFSSQCRWSVSLLSATCLPLMYESVSACVCVSSNVFKSLLLQFSSDPHKAWHTWSMCLYAENCGTDFCNFDFKFFDAFFKF